MDRNVFMETLREVKEIVRTAAKPLTREEIMGYFKETELTPLQENMVMEYLFTDEEPQVENVPCVENEPETVAEDIVESKVFGMYMEEVNNLKIYSDNELSMMYVKLLQGDKDVISKICDSWMKRIVDEAREYPARYCLEDIIQEGNMGLFLKLTELCGSKQAVDVEEELSCAVTTAMKDYISDIAGEEDSEQTVLGKANLINEAIKLLREERGEEPSVEALSLYTGLDIDELCDILEIIKKADKK